MISNILPFFILNLHIIIYSHNQWSRFFMYKYSNILALKHWYVYMFYTFQYVQTSKYFDQSYYQTSNQSVFIIFPLNIKNSVQTFKYFILSKIILNLWIFIHKSKSYIQAAKSAKTKTLMPFEFLKDFIIVRTIEHFNIQAFEFSNNKIFIHF